MTVLAFIVALIFTFAGVQEGDSYSNRNQNTNDQDASDPKVAVTSRGMAVAALWTAVLATLISIFGTVILGWQSPTGRYYSCCSTKVHQTNALSLGSFIGTVFMFANLTFICAILFGEFEIRDRCGEGEGRKRDGVATASAVARSSTAFSIACLFLTLLYGGFVSILFVYSESILEELTAVEKEDLHNARCIHSASPTPFATAYTGYIGERFDVRRNLGSSAAGLLLMTPKPANCLSDGTLT